MIRALVVDDEALSRRAVKQLCARHPDVTVVGECRNGMDAADALKRIAVDVVFLDVKMPRLSGLELAGATPDATRPLMVFVTAYESFALPAFDTAAIDYLTKPLDPERFALALERVRTQLSLLDRAATRTGAPAYQEALVARVRDRDVLVPADTIEFIAAEDVYAEVHASGGVYLVRQSLDRLEKRLDPARFVRIHRSFIVHLQQVTALRRANFGARTVVMQSRAELPLSRRRSHAVRRLIEQRRPLDERK